MPRARAAWTKGLELSAGVHDGDPVGDVRVGVGQDVSRPQVLQQQVFQRQRGRLSAEVHHHRHARLAAGLDRARDRIPLVPEVMGHLDSDDQAGMLADPRRRQLGVHVREVLLLRAARHAAPTMFRKASTRVFARSMTWVLNCGKFRHPEPPTSTSVVWPLRKEWLSGCTAL